MKPFTAFVLFTATFLVSFAAGQPFNGPTNDELGNEALNVGRGWPSYYPSAPMPMSPSMQALWDYLATRDGPEPYTRAEDVPVLLSPEEAGIEDPALLDRIEWEADHELEEEDKKKKRSSDLEDDEEERRKKKRADDEDDEDDEEMERRRKRIPMWYPSHRRAFYQRFYGNDKRVAKRAIPYFYPANGGSSYPWAYKRLVPLKRTFFGKRKRSYFDDIGEFGYDKRSVKDEDERKKKDDDLIVLGPQSEDKRKKRMDHVHMGRKRRGLGSVVKRLTI